MGHSFRIFIAVILIISIFTVSVFATPTGTYDLYGTNGRNIYGYTGSSNDYITNFSSHFAHIQVYLDQILSYNSNISSTLDYYLPALLTRMIDNFSPGAGDNRTMWQLSAAAVSGITAIQSAALGIAQDVYGINTTVSDIDYYTSLIYNSVDGIEPTLTSTNTKLDTINTNIDEVETKLGTSNTLLYNLESINWINVSEVDFQFSYDNVDYYTFDNLPSPSNSNRELYIKILNSDPREDSLLNFTIPFWVNPTYQGYSPDIEFYIANNNFQIYPDFYIFNNFRYFSLFLFPFNFSSTDFIIKINFNYRFYKRSSFSNSFNYLSTSSNDFYIVDQFIQNHKQSEDSTLSDIKNILLDIDNNSDFIHNNNDLEINVDIDAADGVAVTGIINKLRSLFSTGVGLSQFLLGLNEFDNLLWFTSLETYQQVNYNPNVPGNGYQDLYD